MTIQHIFVIGAGTMGNGIAQAAATSGYQVTCMDVMPAALEKARAAIAKSTGKKGDDQYRAEVFRRRDSICGKYGHAKRCRFCHRSRDRKP
jgi:3-hydroxyacyl-CoA dehydrogenase